MLYVITKSNWGGAQRYVFDLATNLPRDRFEVAVITGGQGLLVEKFIQSRIQVIELPVLQKGSGFGSVFFSFRNFQAFFKLITVFSKEKPDIIHLNSSKIGGIGAAAAFVYKIINYKLSIITVFTAHGWPFLEPRPYWQRGFIFFFSWLGSILQDVIITINTHDFEVGKKFIPRRKLHLIFNGLGAFKLLAREQARGFLSKFTQKEISPDSMVIGAVSEYNANKGIEYLLDAVHQARQALPQVSWIVLVIGEGEAKEKLERRIKSLGLGDSVKLTGFIPEVRQYLKGLDLLVLPSLKEGLPYVVMEAMYAGVPVVATKVGGLPDLVTDGKDGRLVLPGNAAALAKTFIKFVTDPEQSKIMAQKAAPKIQENFLLENMIQHTLNLYAQA